MLCADAQQVQEHPRPEQQLRPIRAQTILEASSAHVPENVVIDQAQFAYLRQPTASHGTRELPELTPAANERSYSVKWPQHGNHSSEFAASAQHAAAAALMGHRIGTWPRWRACR